jgi:CBS domain-containing protein/sporulation protein YlmC with PRC-barrel domain
MIYFTEIQNLPAYGAKGEYLGRIVDLLVDPSQNSRRVAAFLVRTPKNELVRIDREQMQSISVRAAQTNCSPADLRPYAPDEGLIHVRKDILDQQIIDVNHRKVVRVNDVDFDIEPSERYSELRILDVNVGLASAVRRLLQGVLAKHTVRMVASLFPAKVIRWEFVNLIEPDPARRVKLRITYDRLAKLHPADIAQILEELSRDEQRSLIESLDEETAAQVLAEIPTHLQAVLLESFSPEKAADIVEEMPPDEAADVLQQLSPEHSAELLADMEKEEAQEVRELLGFEENTAGALMTTEYIMVGEEAEVAGAIEALRNFEGPIESVHAIYLVNPAGVLTGVVPVGRILLADAATPLKSLSDKELISAHAYDNDRVVVDLFQKYNLVSLPVVDDSGHLLGVVTADDVLDLVVKRQ